jgi:hypothetical protein
MALEDNGNAIVLGVIITIILIPIFGALISTLTSVFDSILFGRLFAIGIMGGFILIMLKLTDRINGY